MTAYGEQAMASHNIAVPAIFDRVVEPTFLMPGESQDDYKAIRDMILQEICPQSGIEWLWAADLVELSWDIIRYRALRQKCLRSVARTP